MDSVNPKEGGVAGGTVVCIKGRGFPTFTAEELDSYYLQLEMEADQMVPLTDEQVSDDYNNLSYVDTDMTSTGNPPVVLFGSYLCRVLESNYSYISCLSSPGSPDTKSFIFENDFEYRD